MRPLSGFSYKRVKTLEEAWGSAARYPGEARYLAGGTDLVVQLKKGTIRTPLLISLKGVRHLNGVTLAGDSVHIGPLTAVGELIRSEALKSKNPLLLLAAVQMGSRQIRNMATVGGNLCNASPAGDLSTALLCLDTEVKIEGPGGARSEKLVDFFKGPGRTSLQPSEILTGLLVPSTDKNWHWNYQKLGVRRAMEIGIVNVALGLNLEREVCREARIALGSVAPTPIRARKAEKLMEGKRFSPELIEEVAEVSARESDPIDDLRASGAYRREMVINLVRRGLRALWQIADVEK
jgi:CO/xanthine dehydrogenase FAD-binding subunit